MTVYVLEKTLAIFHPRGNQSFGRGTTVCSLFCWGRGWYHHWCIIISNIDVYDKLLTDDLVKRLKMCCTLIPSYHFLSYTKFMSLSITRLPLSDTFLQYEPILISWISFCSCEPIAYQPLQIMHVIVEVLNGLNACIKVININI